jgi:hypothetical protein
MIKGNKAVPAMGTASVIHQMAIQRVRPNINLPSSGRPDVGTKKYSSRKAKGPAIRPKV